MGLFADWQPRYADHGIATFPVRIEGDAKRPAVRGYLKIGPDVSRQLALKFVANDSFGFAVKRAGIAVLDIDTPDGRVLADALDRHGPTPFVVRSGSGHFHAYYRHGGEPRRIRPWGRDVPIDVLGDGYVVAPPSQAARGRYEIIQGTLDDLDRLPAMRGCGSRTRDDDSPRTREAPIGEGKRNDSLFGYCMAQAHHCDDWDALLDVARTYADTKFAPPLPDKEIVRTASSAWGYTERGENRFGVGGVVQFTHEDIDGLMMEDPDAYILETKLKRHHWGREFVIANAMADSMPGRKPGRGWTPKRLAAARRALERRQRIIKIRPAISGVGPALYRWPRAKGGQN